MSAKNYKETKVYQLAFEQAMDVFETSKTFPREETYSLTDQVRRSSRSVCTNLAEAYRKKRYPAHFISKITDSDSENSETVYGLILQWRASISLNKSTMSLSNAMKQLENC
jgi:four helix bundle protein